MNEKIEISLKKANELLSKLINLTEEGIEDIKNAKKDRLDFQNQEKMKLMELFTKEKSNLDSSLVELASSNPEISLSDLLSANAQDLLQQLKFNLNYLYAKNKEYARYVMQIKEFYDSLLENMLKDNIENHGYESIITNTSSISSSKYL